MLSRGVGALIESTLIRIGMHPTWQIYPDPPSEQNKRFFRIVVAPPCHHHTVLGDAWCRRRWRVWTH